MLHSSLNQLPSRHYFLVAAVVADCDVVDCCDVAAAAELAVRLVERREAARRRRDMAVDKELTRDHL